MDGSISPIPPGTPQPARAVRGLVERRRRREDEGFDSALEEEAEEQPQPPADEDDGEPRDLDVGTTEPDEAGRNLDLTA